MYNLEPGSVDQNTSVCLSNNNMVRNKKKKSSLEILTCYPSNHIMDHTDFIVTSLMEDSTYIKKVTVSGQHLLWMEKI